MPILGGKHSVFIYVVSCSLLVDAFYVVKKFSSDSKFAWNFKSQIDVKFCQKKVNLFCESNNYFAFSTYLSEDLKVRKYKFIPFHSSQFLYIQVLSIPSAWKPLENYFRVDMLAKNNKFLFVK